MIGGNVTNALNVFAIPIFEYFIKEDTSELLNCNNFVISANNSTNSTVYNNKTYRILENYQKSKKIFTEFFNSFAYNELGIENSFKISTSWITLTKKNQTSHIHTHTNCFFSGVYYFDNDYEKNSGELILMNPIKSFSSYSFLHHSKNSFNALYQIIKPEPKKLVLFPSFLRHCVGDYFGETDRKSLAFNFVPVGEYGAADSFIDSSCIKEDINHIKYS